MAVFRSIVERSVQFIVLLVDVGLELDEAAANLVVPELSSNMQWNLILLVASIGIGSVDQKYLHEFLVLVPH